MSRTDVADNADDRLGTLEFISAINGDDPLAALRALRKFGRTVRRERKLALVGGGGGSRSSARSRHANEDDSEAGAGSADSDSEDDSDGDLDHLLDSSSSSKKKRRTTKEGGNSKRDQWKDDTAGYNVPFVGTSVIKGSTGTPIRRGVWPCGLLEAYLRSSPRAVELLGGLQTTTSRSSASAANDDGGKGSGGRDGGRNDKANYSRNVVTTNTNQLVPPHGALHRPLLKSGKTALSSALHQAYLEAVEEVCTAVVPVGVLRRDYYHHLEMEVEMEIEGKKDGDAQQPNTTTYDAIATALARDHLRPFLHLLNEQCSRAASFDPRHGGGGGGGGGNISTKGGGGGRHRVGPLTPTLLRILTNVAATGVGAAREVVRGLDSELRDGALRAALAAYSGGAASSSSSSSLAGDQKAGGKKRKAADGDADDDDDDDEEEKEEDEPSPTSTKRKCKVKPKMDARTAALRMCSVLLESSDPTVLSFVCSGGSRERKTNAGVVHTALRVGLAGGLFDTRRNKRSAAGADGLPSVEALESNAGYLQLLGRFLASIRHDVLLSDVSNDNTGNSKPSRRHGLEGRVLLELLNGDVMDQLMRISKFATSLEDVGSFRAVLTATDFDETDDNSRRHLRHAARECRRVLFLLLGDKNNSPFLSHIHDEATAAKEIGGRSSPQEHIVNRALMWLLNNEHSLPMRAFILHCLRTTPQLLLSFFRSLPMPEAKPTYECLSAIAFVSNLMTDGPSILDCLGGAISSTIASDQAMHLILPTSVSKTFLTRAVQNPNALLVAEALRLISDALKRADEGGNQLMVSGALQKRLPDLQILLSLRSRFDPFSLENQNEAADEGDEEGVLSKEEVVALRFCEVLQLYGRILPSTAISNVKFDWAKLFPDDLASFFSVSSTLQLSILETYGANAIQHGAGLSPANSHKALRTLLTIVLSSTSASVYDLARKLAISLIRSSMSGDSAEHDDETRRCLEYEAILWVDGCSEETLEEVLSLVAASSQHTTQHVLSASRAWSALFPSAAMPQLCFSGILSAAIARCFLDYSGVSPDFGCFVCQVATKVLLYHRCPRSLASFIKYCGGVSGRSDDDDDDDDDDTSSYRRLLLRHVNSLLEDESTLSPGTLVNLTSSIFGKENVHSKLCQVEAGQTKYPLEPATLTSRPTVIVRQCLTRLASIRTHPNASSRDRLHAVIQRTLAYASDNDQGDILRDIYQHPYMLSGCGSTGEAANFVSSLAAPHHAGASLKANETYLVDFGELWIETFADALANDQVCDALAALISSLSALIGPSFSVQVVGLILKKNQGLDRSDVLRSLLLTTLASIGKVHSIDRAFPVGDLVQVWIGLASSNNTTKDEQIDIPLQLALEGAIGNILVWSELNGTAAANLATALSSNIREVFSSYVASTVLSKDHRAPESCNLLAAMVEYDCALFIPLLSDLLALEKQSLLKLQLGEQWFSAISPLLLAYAKQLPDVSVFPICSSLGELAWQGVEAVLTEAPRNLEQGNIELVKDWLTAMKSLLANGDIVRSEDAFESTIVFFKTLASRPKLRLSVALEEPMLDAVIGLCSDASCDKLTRTQLSSYIFLRLLTLLPRALRKGRGHKSQAAVKDHDPTFILNSLLRLLNESDRLEEDVILDDESSVRTGFISCLKYGIKGDGATGDESSVAQLCLRFARALVVSASTQHPALLENVEMLHPAQVHRMVTSHSSFSTAIQQVGADAGTHISPRQDLIHLLICCASLGSGALEDGEDAWKAVLRAYSAGVTREDKALRRLMHLYSNNTEEKVSSHFIDTLKWGDVSGVSDSSTGTQGSSLDGSDHAQQYEWFVQALDVRRVRSTLSCFPVWERLVPEVDPSLEPWAAENEEDEAVGNDSSSTYSGASGDEISGDEEGSDDEGMAGAENDSAPRPRRKEDQSDRWNGSGTDDRYSPPFILTLALATLEAFNTSSAPPTKQESQDHNLDAEDSDNMSTEEDPTKPQRETFVKIARRLSEKGCISLGLAALSSKCPNVRRVAIATLGLFLKAVHMEEAHSLKTWRERPQIAMVLDSVQRGITVRRAITLARRKEEGAEDQPLLIPMFPAVSAVFLGWSALIVSRPSDDMFASANRSFLRLDDYHGAFKDCFALPAFISLFCGSFAEENSQARRERLWALQLLKDGIRDSYCYKVAARRHAPALIMTSFESLVSCGGLHDADAEPYLLLEAIECLLLNGGHASRHHLISNLGLCSWLRCILIGKQHSFAFPSSKMLLLFVRLVDNAFKCAVREDNEETGSVGDVMSEAMAMAGPLVDACDKMCCNITAEAAIGEIWRTLFSSLGTLSICSSLGLEGKAPPLFESLRDDGIPIVSACKLLKEATESSEEASTKVTRALSTLPISTLSGHYAIGKQFCLSLLQNARHACIGGGSAILLGNVLTRVGYVLDTFDDKLHGDWDLIEAILSCKSKAQWCDEGPSALAKSIEVLGG